MQESAAMFERLTESAKRAIFFARATTHWNDAPSIDSSHLLYGLMWDDDSRAQVLFHLREIFPLYRECPYKFADLEAAPKRNPPLTDYAKKILARTVMQADAMGEYWIDTEHLLLGILAEPDCLAAQNLAKADITLENARRVVMENKHSRPPNGPIVRPGESPSPMDRLIYKWRMWRFRARAKARVQ